MCCSALAYIYRTVVGNVNPSEWLCVRKDADGSRTLRRSVALSTPPPEPSRRGTRIASTRRPAPPFRGLAPALVALAAVLAYGIGGYILIEGFSFLDALFMTVITVTTVGYEEVHHLDSAGQVFTISVIAFGVLDFLYTFGVIVEQLASDRWREWWRYGRVDKELAELRDHVIVCGYGRTGTQIGRALERGGHPFVVVEMNSDGLANVAGEKRLCVVGDAATDAVLERAGITRAVALISAVDSDERNVYIVLTARSLNPRLFIVARSSYPDSVSKLQRAGADRVVSPYTECAQRMAALAVQPALVDVIDSFLGDGSPVTLEELVVGDGATATTAGQLRQSGVTLLAIRSGGELTVGPDDELRLSAGDLVIALGGQAELEGLARSLAPTRP